MSRLSRGNSTWVSILVRENGLHLREESTLVQAPVHHQSSPIVLFLPEALNVEAEDVGQPPDPELLSGGLLPATAAAEEALRLPQLLNIREL